ncbi:MAG: hypothetical protein ACI92G_003508, partial [Candidatus Pelagisphaera sp.]
GLRSWVGPLLWEREGGVLGEKWRELRAFSRDENARLKLGGER